MSEPDLTGTGATEQVVLVDDDGRVLGSRDKADTHGPDTPLHLGFSVYLFDADGRFLLSRRALDKATFPGVWTNSCCGHPAPGEAVEDAVVRRVRVELGAAVADLRLVLPAFGYRAEMAGVVEHELCPVLVGRVSDPDRLAPDATEVVTTRWVDWAPFRDRVLGGEEVVSHWCARQVAELAALGDDPTDWPTADRAGLPVALREIDPPSP